MKMKGSDKHFSSLMTSFIRSTYPSRRAGKYTVVAVALITVTMYSWLFVSIDKRPRTTISVGTELDQYLIPEDDILKALTDFQLLDVFTKYINSHQILCRNHQRVGSFRDGGKEVCNDYIVRPKPPCLVYSFGKLAEDNEGDIIVNASAKMLIQLPEKTSDDIQRDVKVNNNGSTVLVHFISNNRFDFEKEAIRMYGCEVLTFDPTMGHIAEKDRQIPVGCKFYLKGLEGDDMPSKSMYRMKTILNDYGHTDRVLDMLKIDIEGSEWSALEDMITTKVLRNVRHLLVEFHFHELTKEEKIKSLRVFRRLYNEGFRIYSRARNIGKSKYVEQLGYEVAYYVELSFINLLYI